jgi:hypothetical protein
MVIQVISHRLVATKGHNSDLLISITSLAEIGTGPHKYLLTIWHIEAWNNGILDILECSWIPSSSFYRVYSVDISSLYTLNLGEAMLNSFIAGALVSEPK